MDEHSKNLVMASALAVTIGLAVAGPVAAQETEQAVLMWSSKGVRGAVAPASSWGELGPNAELHAGDSLKTPADGKAFLVFDNGAKLVLGQSSIVRFQDLNGLGTRLMAGAVRLSAAPEGVSRIVAGPLRLEMRNAEAIIEKSGAAWRVTMLAGQATVVDVGQAGKNRDTIAPGSVMTWSAGRRSETALSGSQFQDAQAAWELPRDNTRPSASPQARDQWVATALSLALPGAGQLYQGDLWPGVIQMGLNGTLAGIGLYAQAVGQSPIALGCGGGLVALNLYSAIDAYGKGSQAASR